MHGTVVAGIVILAASWTRADAVASLVVVVLTLEAAWELLHVGQDEVLPGLGKRPHPRPDSRPWPARRGRCRAAEILT